ncbi:hypothetical protein [Nostoc sp.]
MILKHHRIHDLLQRNLCVFSNYTTCAIAQGLKSQYNGQTMSTTGYAYALSLTLKY